jgi:hypothetical protein
MPDQPTRELIYIETDDGKKIDISYELSEMQSISRMFCAEDSRPHSDERQWLHRTGWGLIRLIGADATIELIGELEEDGVINSYFATYLYRKWSELATAIDEAEAAD